MHSASRGKNRSTTTNLIESLNDLTLTILSTDQHVVVYVDLSKAFDVASHDRIPNSLPGCIIMVAYAWCIAVLVTNFLLGELSKLKSISDCPKLLCSL